MTSILGAELLRGERLYLNRLTRDDLPVMARMWSDTEFFRHLSRNPAYGISVEQMESWYKHMDDNNEEYVFAIRRREDDRFIGACALKDIRWASRHCFFWVGIGDASLRGQGYGSEAIRLLLAFAFCELNLHCVGLEVMAYNERALAAYRKLGFQHDGMVRDYCFRDDRYYAMHLMSMLRSEWEERYGRSLLASRQGV